MNHISKYFRDYRSVIMRIDTDLDFWKSFLELSIKNYQSQEVTAEEIYSSTFSVYNINGLSNRGILVPFNDCVSVKTIDLDLHKKMFFSWVMNLSLLKSYNALEVLLLQAIWIKYYPDLDNPISNKKGASLQKKIKEHLGKIERKVDTKNNRHLIEFFKIESTEFNNFLQLPVRIDLTTTWGDFFEMFSILRNVIAHQGTVISEDTLNAIASKANDIFDKFFSIEEIDDYMHLVVNENGMTSILDFTNDFAVNSVRFLYKESDLGFLR